MTQWFRGLPGLSEHGFSSQKQTRRIKRDCDFRGSKFSILHDQPHAWCMYIHTNSMQIHANRILMVICCHVCSWNKISVLKSNHNGTISPLHKNISSKLKKSTHNSSFHTYLTAKARKVKSCWHWWKLKFWGIWRSPNVLDLFRE